MSGGARARRDGRLKERFDDWEATRTTEGLTLEFKSGMVL